MISRSCDIVAREVGGETVLLDLEKGTYFGLNPVGGRIWSFLDGGDRTLADIVDMIVGEFIVERDEAAKDAIALIEEMISNGLVRIVGS